MNVIQQQPVITAGVIAAVATFLVQWLAQGQPVQGAILGLVTAVLAVIAHTQVTPTVNLAGK